MGKTLGLLTNVPLLLPLPLPPLDRTGVLHWPYITLALQGASTNLAPLLRANISNNKAWNPIKLGGKWIRTVLKFPDSQLSYEQKEKVILCRNGWENSVWSESIKISFCYCNKAVTFSYISRTIEVQISYPGTFPTFNLTTNHGQN